jgi:hypothetical protein
MIVGGNDMLTAKRLRLTAIEYPDETIDSRVYLAWVKKMTRAGYAVTICIYQVRSLFRPRGGLSRAR